MNRNFEKWIEKQSESLFKGVGVKPGKKAAKHFTIILSLPFFFVPVLIAGYVVADVGEAMSKQAVAFLRSQEVRPEKPIRVVAQHKNKTKNRKSMVVTHTETPSDFEAHAKP